MKIKFIVCQVLRRELEHAARSSPHTIDFTYIEAGLHEKPAELRVILQSAITQANKEDWDYIVLGYGICGRGTIGLTTQKIPVVIPRTHDCIALFLGSNREYMKQFAQYPGTYYLSASWIQEKSLPQLSKKRSFLPDEETYRQYVEKFGIDNAEFIYNFFNKWKKNYKRLVFVSTGVQEEDQYRSIAREYAEANRLRYEDIVSDRSFFQNSVNANWDERDFLILKHGCKTILDKSRIITSIPVREETDRKDDSAGLEIHRRHITLNGGNQREEVEIGLGIDAGGTYTDAVIFDFKHNRLISKAKALTTKHNLKKSILRAIDQLDGDYFPRIQKVVLSTTLATNAIVENKTRPVGLLVMGLWNSVFSEITFEPKRRVKGEMDITGRIEEDVDPDEVIRVVQSLISTRHIQAAAVSGFGSVVNPAQEQQVKEIIQKHFNLPVICGHELSMKLNCLRRANTAVMNAQLIPLLKQLITSIRMALNDRQFGEFTYQIVRGDGTLVSASYAMEYPVQTTLSGPAASCIGSLFLTNERDGLIIDIGGTTTDLIPVNNGLPERSQSGAVVGGIRTSIPTLDITTHGLGGDSYIQMIKTHAVEIGPRRVIPISMLGNDYECVIEQLEELNRHAPFSSSLCEPVDFFIARRHETGYQLKADEKKIVDLITERPMSRWHLSKKLECPDPSLLPVENLENLGIIERSALTPTDILVYNGKLNSLNTKAVQLVLQIYKKETRKTISRITDEILTDLTDRFSFCVFTKAMLKELPEPFHTDLNRGKLLHTLFTEKQTKRGYSINFNLDRKMIGIGAPAKAYLPEVGRKLNTEITIPEHFEVANALGAIVGRLIADVEVTIKGGDCDTFIVSSEHTRKVFNGLKEATVFAYQEAEAIALQKAKEMGAREIELSVFHENHYGSARDAEVFLQRTVNARAESSPVFGSPEKLNSIIYNGKR